MTRLVRLNDSQRVIFESVEINERNFLKIDLLEAGEDGSERSTKLLVEASKIQPFVAALTAASEQQPTANG